MTLRDKLNRLWLNYRNKCTNIPGGNVQNLGGIASGGGALLEFVLLMEIYFLLCLLRNIFCREIEIRKKKKKKKFIVIILRGTV